METNGPPTGRRKSPRISEAVAAGDLGNRGAGHIVTQLGMHLFQPDRVQGSQRRSVVEPAKYRVERSDTTACRSCDPLHADRNGCVRLHKLFGTSHIGWHRTEPAAPQPP